MSERIAQLEAELAEVRRLVTIASECWYSTELCNEEEYQAMEALIAWVGEEE